MSPLHWPAATRMLCWHTPPRIQMDEFKVWPLVTPSRLPLPACGVCGIGVMRANSGALYHTEDEAGRLILIGTLGTPHMHAPQLPEVFT